MEEGATEKDAKGDRLTDSGSSEEDDTCHRSECALEYGGALGPGGIALLLLLLIRAG